MSPPRHIFLHASPNLFLTITNLCLYYLTLLIVNLLFSRTAVGRIHIGLVQSVKGTFSCTIQIL